MTPAAEASETTAAAIDVGRVEPSDAFLSLIARDFAREHLVLSAGADEQGATERLLIAESTPFEVIHNVGVRLGRTPEPVVAAAEQVAARIDVVYAAAGHADSAGEVHEDSGTGSIEQLIAAADQDLLSTSGKGPVVRLLDALLFDALRQNASDLHIQPLADRTLIRYRIDGVLQTVREVSRTLTAPLVSRVKVIGRMDIAERRVPQDGRATVTIGAGESARSIDLRISTLPTSYGERAVLRLLESARGEYLRDFESLGMPSDTQERYLACAGRAFAGGGIVLVTGPTGSGKTTTLYATLRWIGSRRGNANDSGVNIMTIEDPIEYELSTVGLAISQAQVNTKKGVTFASGLRHILRQDPDVVMVGEIRDAETARVAIQSSLTGHLVFSTLHTNDAPGAVTRLVDLGVEPYLVSASLSAVLAQRLVRTLHPACRGRGCAACFDTGYKGRTGVYELLVIDERTREAVSDGANAGRLSGLAIEAGMTTLADAGRRLAADGVTSEAELARVIAQTDVCA